MTELVRVGIQEPPAIHRNGNGYLLVKVAVLTLLSMLNAVVVVLTHYVRTREADMFLASSAVVTSEVIKVSTCLVITFLDNPYSFWSTLHDSTLGDLQGWSRTAIPACIYAVQNNLVFFALSHLNSVIFQVTYQLKILTTALFSVVLLNKCLQPSQWFSLLLLFAGVVVVQVRGGNSENITVMNPNKALALCAVLIACVLSGFASVYFEKILKGSSQTIWVRNIQLGVPGAIFALLAMIATDRQKIMSHGFFHGYDTTVWILVILQAAGGLVVACVVKYTDNIIKTFAMATAILLSLSFSALLFHTDLDLQMVVGSTLVIIAVFIYSLVKS